MTFFENSVKKKIYSVSELTSNIKELLEDSFPIIWISGEISNFSKPNSGHYYFTLKDASSQISAVMFRGQNKKLTFLPEHGMKITGLGRISVYEPRGTYQLIFEYIEPAGTGSLQVAFEQLKNRLAEEGLFDEKHKKSIPWIPRKISVITSPSGAVVHDILKIAKRRFINSNIQIIPVKVQGIGSEQEIASAIRLLNNTNDSDVAILARGGGSLEDLQAFNSEIVARAIFESEIPIVSAVGHETDYTISDFVADLRAPTPSAAAELVIPLKDDLKQKLSVHFIKLIKLMNFQKNNRRSQLNELSLRLTDPKRKITDYRLKNDDLFQRMTRTLSKKLSYSRERLLWRKERLMSNNPNIHIKNLNKKQKHLTDFLIKTFTANIKLKRSGLSELSGKLQTLNPTAILKRGFSITRTIPGSTIVKDADAVLPGQDLEIMVSKGIINCQVKGKPKNGI